MKFAEKVRRSGLLPGYSIQKISEFLFSSTLWSIYALLIEKYSSDPQYYGLYNKLQPLEYISASFGVTLAFNIFTLYPVIMFAPLLISRKVFNLGRLATAVVSALSSLSYVVGWVFFTGFSTDWPLWIIFVFTALFVFWSSFLFYSTRPTEEPSLDELSQDI